MNIYQCQRKAKDVGFDSAKFVAMFPAGPKECKWLDAYFGFFQVEGIEGFLSVNDIDEQFPDLHCSEPYVD